MPQAMVISSNKNSMFVAFSDGGNLTVNLFHVTRPLTIFLAKLAGDKAASYSYEAPPGGRDLSYSANFEPHEPVSFERMISKFTLVPYRDEILIEPDIPSSPPLVAPETIQTPEAREGNFKGVSEPAVETKEEMEAEEKARDEYFDFSTKMEAALRRLPPMEISSDNNLLRVVFFDGGTLTVNLDHFHGPLTDFLARLASLGCVGFLYKAPPGGHDFSHSAFTELLAPISFETMIPEITRIDYKPDFYSRPPYSLPHYLFDFSV